MKLNLALLPYNNTRKYLYSIEFTTRTLALLETKKWNSKIKSIVPVGSCLRLPLVICDGEVEGRRIHLASTRYKLRYISAAALRRAVLEKFNFIVIEEPRKCRPIKAFGMLKDANKTLHNYFVISSENVYSMGFEPPNLTISRYVILKYTVVFIT